MSTESTELNSLAQETNYVRAGHFGRTRASCGQIVFYKHRAPNGDDHYRRGVSVCRKASCDVPGCRRNWITERREEIFARADLLFDRDVGPTKAQFEAGFTVVPTGPVYDPFQWAKTARSELKDAVSGVWVTHLEWCPLHPHDEIHGHFYGMRAVRGSPDPVRRPSCVATPNMKEPGEYVTDMLDWAALKFHSRRGTGTGDTMGDPTGVKFSTAVTWFGDWAFRAPKDAGDRVESGAKIRKAAARDRCVRCPVCQEEVPRGSWTPFRWAPGAPIPDDSGVVQSIRHIESVTGRRMRSWDEY